MVTDGVIGALLIKCLQLDAALRAYAQSIEQNNGHIGSIHKAAALVLGHLQKPEVALRLLQSAVERRAATASTFYLMGRCYMLKEEFPKAFSAYRTALYVAITCQSFTLQGLGGGGETLTSGKAKAGQG